MTTSPMRLSFIAAGIAVALFMSGGAKAEGIASGCMIGGTEGISNCAQKVSCPAPTVTAVSPNSGSNLGGTAVTLTGTGFTGATAVNFGTANPASFSITNSTTIAVASSPSGAAATIDVTVTTPCGTSATSAADHFTYVGFQGIGDIVATNAMLYYSSTFAYSSATRGNRLMNVCNSTGGVDVGCADMVTDVATGILVPQVIGGITCPGPNCTIKTRYDISGALFCTGGTAACDVTQATVANRYVLTANVIGSLLCAVGSGGTQGYVSSVSSQAQNEPVTFVSMGERTGAFTTQADMLDMSTGGGVSAGWLNSANTFFAFAGNVASVTASDSAFHAFQVVFNGVSNSILAVDATQTGSKNVGANNIASAVISSGPTTHPLTGNLCEDGAFSIAFSGTQLTNVSANIHARYGF